MMSAEETRLPGLIEQSHYSRSELHGFEVDMYGRVIVPEFHPRTPDEVGAYIKFESELPDGMDAGA